MTADECIANLEEQLKQALEQVQVLHEQLAAALSRTLWCNPRHENTHFGLSFTIWS
jgi:hypothetical protein